MKAFQVAVGVFLAVTAAILAVAAAEFRADPSYSGIGPAFYPNAVAGLLALCGIALIREALTGGYRNLPPPEPGNPGRWRGFVLIGGALLVSAFLITRIGFPLTCTMVFAVSAYAFGSRRHGVNIVAGLIVSLLVFWMFGKGLGLILPSLLPGGWI